MQKRFRDESIRLKNWDYGSNAAYFITICTQDRVHCFGDVVNGEMHYSKEGIIVTELWNEIPKKFPFAKIDSFIIMPNHVHGIISITKPYETPGDFERRRLISQLTIDQINSKIGGITGLKNPMLNQNLSGIIRWFKGRCSFEIHKNSKDFMWQSRYHDRLIRTKESYYRIRRYIENNSKNWERDKMSK